MKEGILDFLKINGEVLDADIAKKLNLPFKQVAHQVAQLSASGDVISCKVTRYIGGEKIEGMSCRLSGSLPTPARGPKPGAKRAPTPLPN